MLDFHNKYNILFKVIAIAVICVFPANDIAWALAPESRIDPFYEVHKIDFANRAVSTMAAKELRNLILVEKAREGEVCARVESLNQRFRKEPFLEKGIQFKIDKPVERRAFKCNTAKEYHCATFRFKNKNEKKVLEVAFFDDYANLSDAELEELGIIKKDKIGRIVIDERHLLASPGFEGVWFINPASVSRGIETMLPEVVGTILDKNPTIQYPELIRKVEAVITIPPDYHYLERDVAKCIARKLLEIMEQEDVRSELINLWPDGEGQDLFESIWDQLHNTLLTYFTKGHSFEGNEAVLLSELEEIHRDTNEPALRLYKKYIQPDNPVHCYYDKFILTYINLIAALKDAKDFELMYFVKAIISKHIKQGGDLKLRDMLMEFIQNITGLFRDSEEFARKKGETLKCLADYLRQKYPEMNADVEAKVLINEIITPPAPQRSDSGEAASRSAKQGSAQSGGASAQAKEFAQKLLDWAKLSDEDRAKSEIQPVWSGDNTKLGQKNERGETITFTPEVYACLEMHEYPISKHKPELVKIYRAIVLREIDIPTEIKEFLDKEDDLTAADVDNFIKSLPEDRQRSVVDATLEVYKMMWQMHDILRDYTRTRPEVKTGDTFQKIIGVAEHMFFARPDKYREWIIIGQLAKAKVRIKTGYPGTAAEVNLSSIMKLKTADQEENDSRRRRIAMFLANLRVSEEGNNITSEGFTVAESCDRCAKLLSEYGIWDEYTRILKERTAASNAAAENLGKTGTPTVSPETTGAAPARRKPRKNDEPRGYKHVPDQDEPNPLDANPPLVPKPSTYKAANEQRNAGIMAGLPEVVSRMLDNDPTIPYLALIREVEAALTIPAGYYHLDRDVAKCIARKLLEWMEQRSFRDEIIGLWPVGEARNLFKNIWDQLHDALLAYFTRGHPLEGDDEALLGTLEETARDRRESVLRSYSDYIQPFDSDDYMRFILTCCNLTVAFKTANVHELSHLADVVIGRHIKRGIDYELRYMLVGFMQDIAGLSRNSEKSARKEGETLKHLADYLRQKYPEMNADAEAKVLINELITPPAPRSSHSREAAFVSAQADAAKVHNENLRLASAIPSNTVICHIAAPSTLPDGQQGILNRLDSGMRGRKYREKMLELKTKTTDGHPIGDFIEQVRYTIQNARETYKDVYGKDYSNYTFKFDVACPSLDLVARVQNELNLPALAFTPQEGEGSAVQPENIMLALRALEKAIEEKDIKPLIDAYCSVTRTVITSSIKDIAEFARIMLFTMPKVNVNELGRINALVEANIKTAA